MTADVQDTLAPVLIGLLRGPTYREDDAMQWQALLSLQARVRDYLGVIGLELILDEAEGYAYLRQRPAQDDAVILPRLIARRQLSYPVSLLLALLRKKLAEFDASGGDTRLILDRDQILDMLRLFLPATGNEARLLDQVSTHISKVIDLGFLRRMRGRDDQYEVRRILKAFVDAQWLNEFDHRLNEYRGLTAPGTREDATP
jgi:hypothetical protein